MSGKEVKRVMQIAVRGIDVDLWRQIRLESVKRGIPASQIVAEALKDWLAKQSK